MDTYSKYVGFIRVTNTNSEEIIEKLINLFAQFGLPKQIVTDNGVQFISSEFDKFCKHYGIQHIWSAPYHPSSNGEAEPFVQTFKHAMKAMSENSRPHAKASSHFARQSFNTTYDNGTTSSRITLWTKHPFSY